MPWDYFIYIINYFNKAVQVEKLLINCSGAAIQPIITIENPGKFYILLE